MRTAATRKFVAIAAIAVNLLLAMMAAAAVEPDEAGDDNVSEVQSEPDVPSDQPTDGGISQREAAHLRFLELLDGKQYGEALIAARQVVELTQQQFGADSVRVVAPLTNLATTQTELDAFEEAEANYKAAVLLIEKHEGFLSPRMVNPLIGLGSVYNRTRRYDEAVTAFERALRINHVNEGFTNTDQLEIRDGLTESYIGLADTDEANFHQETQLEIHRRRFGTQSSETASAYKKLGDWYARSGQLEPALESYGRADRIFRGEGNEVLYKRIASLEALAQLYQQLGQLGTSSSVLRKALEIIDAEPDQDFPLRARILVDLGDLYTIFNKIESAGRRYVQAWADLSRDEEFLDDRDEYFDQPVRVAGLRLATLSSTATAPDAPRSRVRDGYVLLSYTVTPTGRATDVKIVESDPPGVMDDKLESLWKRSKFRPRYVDGQPVAAENLLLRHDFKYALEPPKPASNDEKPRGNGELEYPDKQLD